MGDIKQKQAELLGTQDFIETVITSIKELRIYPRLNVHVDRVLLVLLLRCVRTAKSVCAFVEQGFGDEAFILCRTMLEICITAFFISNRCSEERSQRYLEYFGKDRENLAKLVEKYQPSAADSFSPDHKRLLEMAKQFKNTHQWSEGGLAGMARERQQWTDENEPSATDYWYEVIYKDLSHTCHCTCVGAHSDLMEINYSATGCYSPFTFWESKGSERNGEKAILNAFLFSAECVRHALHGLQIATPKQIADKRNILEQVFKCGVGPI